MEFTKEVLTYIQHGEDVEDFGIEIIEDTGWQDGGKYSFKDVVWSHNKKYYTYSFDRSGSYYTEYYYGLEYASEEIECQEVIPKEVITTTWVKKP